MLDFIRHHKAAAWLAGDREAFRDWEDAELEEITRLAATV